MASLLPLDTWRNILGYHPWHFWGWADDTIVPVTSACNTVVFQHPWQMADAAGRDEISRAIEQAEERIKDFLLYYPAPKYLTKELMFPRYPDQRFDRVRYIDGSGRWPAVKVEGHVQKVGVETLTLLSGAAVNVTYSDLDGDGLDESWSASVAVTFTDTTQVDVYFAAADRLDGDPVGERYKIAPVKVTISGGVATVKGKSWLMGKPILYEGFGENILDPLDATNFVSTVEIYRHYCDPTGTTVDTAQSKLIWETRPHAYFCACTSCSGVVPPGFTNYADPAAEGYGIARVALRQAELGELGVGEAAYDVTQGVWLQINWNMCRPPDRILVRYLAGKPLVNGEMEKRFQNVVTYLAAAELAKPICACQQANKNLYNWQFDLARTGGADGESYGAISVEDLNNPFGTRRGQVYAWKETRTLRQLGGFAI